MKNAPCKGCPDREQACWSKCELYKVWKKKNDEKRDAVEQAFLADDARIRARGFDRKRRRTD